MTYKKVAQRTKRDHSENRLNDETEHDLDTKLDDSSSFNDLDSRIVEHINMGKLAIPLFFCGLICILFGIGFSTIGALSFVHVPNFETRQSFQVESKWTNFILVSAGIFAIFCIFWRNVTAICATFTCSMIGTCFALTTTVLHAVNYYYRTLDVDYYANQQLRNGTDREIQHVSLSQTVSGLYLSLSILSLCAFLIAGIMLTLAYHLICANYSPGVHHERRSLRLTVVGMCQIFLGITITSLWALVETLFNSEGVDIHALPSSEMLCHGLVVLCAGVCLTLSMGRNAKPFLISATILQGVTYAVTAFYGDRALSVLSFTLDHSRGMMGGHAFFEDRAWLCVALGILYIVAMFSSFYAFFKLLRTTTESIIPDLMVNNDTKGSLLRLCYIQYLLSFVYAFIDLMAVGMFVLYKLDFTPLPIFIFSQGLFIYTAIYYDSTPVLNVGVIFGILCAVYSIRDLYLFAYHIFNVGSPDVVAMTSASSTGFRLTLHIALAFVAFAEFLVAIRLTMLTIRVLLKCTNVSYEYCDVKVHVFWLRFMSYLQSVSALSIFCIGLTLFLGNSLFMETFGDVSIVKALLMALSSVLLFAQIKRPGLLITSFITQVFLFTLILLQADSLAYFIDNHLDLPEPDTIVQHPEDNTPRHMIRTQNNKDVNMSYANFVLFLLNSLVAGLSSLILGDLLRKCNFSNNLIIADEFKHEINELQNF